MSRRPFSKYWKGPILFAAAAFAAFTLLLWAGSYGLALATLALTVIGYGAYGVGNSSDLPGTSADHDDDVPT